MTSDHVTQKRAVRIDAILDAATELVVESGLEALTLQRLAGDLGLATSALYRYFPGKTELVVALQTRAIAELASEITAELDFPSESRAEALARVWIALDVFLEGPVRHPARHGLIDAFLSAPEAQLDAAALATVEATLGPLLAAVAQALGVAAERGALEPGDAQARTRLAWAAMHGLHHLRRRDRVEPRARRSPALGRAMIETLFLGWGASQETLERARALLKRRGKLV